MEKFFCKLTNKYCIITGKNLDSSTFFIKSTIKGLKDCSNKTCKYRGQKNCLLKNLE